jgi:uncharacterized protein DUF7002
MDVELLVELYPRLFHMAEGGSLRSIERHGLLSTSWLLDKFEVVEGREAIESQRRAQMVTISHPTHGEAVIRDQKPMIESRLERCLTGGMSPRAWYELLNGYVFFWLNEERLSRLLSARPYRNREHDVFTLDAAQLVQRYEESIFLAPYNTGSTAYEPPPRGRETFKSIADYPFDEWRAKRGVRDAVVELVVLGGVADITDFVVSVERRRGAETLEALTLS